MSQHIGPRTISAIGGSIKRVGNYRIHTFPSELVTDGLVLNLDAGDPRSYPSVGATWTDLSGNGNNGTLINGPTYDNANGGSIVFDRVNHYASSFSSPISVTGSRTVSCFFKTNTTARTGLISTRGALGATGWVLTVNRATAGNLTYFHTGGSEIQVPAGISTNIWYNAVVTYNEATATAILYLNGVRIGNPLTSFSAISPSSFNGIIGAEDQNFNIKFGGNISIVQVYNRALSAAEVAQNYDALKVRYTSYTNTFTPLCAGGEGKVEVLCVAGGGGGQNYYYGGGGGAGGLLYNSAFSINSNSQISVTVGAGGTGGSSNGGNTTFSILNSIGGGTGATSGGSGGGASSVSGTGGAGTTGQGFSGATGSTVAGGGGGGAGGPGLQATSTNTQSGGPGLQFSISGTPQFYAGGGAGAMNANYNYFVGRGGSDVGGNAAGDFNGPTVQAINAIPNTGSGGGGGCWNNTTIGSNGSNGIVIVRYPASDYNVELLIVGGGGGGGLSVGSGGGAGGLIYYSSYPVSSGTKYTVTVGAGSAGMTNTAIAANNGNNSVFGSLVAFGGGGGTGQSVDFPNGAGGKLGGSGSGGSRNQITPGNGVSGQGNRGGFGSNSAAAYGGGGGGGAGAVGGDGSASSGGNGGIGLVYSITGTSTYYAGGGGGSSNQTGTGSGGLGGGGAGTSNNVNGVNGTANTGGGGGGADAAGGATAAGNGGSGIIIIAYKGPQRGIGGTVDTTSRPGYTLHTFTTTGTDFFIP